MIEKTCDVCGETFTAKRSDKRTCSDACRAKKSRRKRDPLIGSSERKRRQRAGQLAGLHKKYAYRRRGQEMRALNALKADRLQRDGWPWLKGYWVEQLQALLTSYYEQSSDVTAEAFKWTSYQHNNADPDLNLSFPSDSFPLHDVYIGFKDAADPAPGWHSDPYWPKPEGPADYTEDVENRAYSSTSSTWNAGQRLPVPQEPRREIRIVARAKWWNRLYRTLPKPPGTFPCTWCGGNVKTSAVLAHKCELGLLGFDLRLSVTETYFSAEEERVIRLFPDHSQSPKQKGDDECAA